MVAAALSAYRPAAAEEATVTIWAHHRHPAVGSRIEARLLKQDGLAIDNEIIRVLAAPRCNMLASELPFAEIDHCGRGRRKRESNLNYHGSLNHVSELAWAVKPGSPYHTLSDLAGQKIASTPRSTTEMVVRAAIKRAGMTGKEALSLGGLGRRSRFAQAPWPRRHSHGRR